jgi:ribosomal protein L30E
MENKKLLSMLNKISDNNKLRNEFVKKLKYIKSLKTAVKNSDREILLENSWNDLYQFVLTVETGFSIESFKNLIEKILNFNEINKSENLDAKNKNLLKDNKLADVNGGGGIEILSIILAGMKFYDIGNSIGKKFKTKMFSIIDEVNSDTLNSF